MAEAKAKPISDGNKDNSLTERINNDFAYHAPTNDEVRKDLEDVRETMRMAARFLVERVPDGRELSVAITKLEEAMMWANAGIARKEPVSNLAEEE